MCLKCKFDLNIIMNERFPWPRWWPWWFMVGRYICHSPKRFTWLQTQNLYCCNSKQANEFKPPISAFNYNKKKKKKTLAYVALSTDFYISNHVHAVFNQIKFSCNQIKYVIGECGCYPLPSANHCFVRNISSRLSPLLIYYTQHKTIVSWYYRNYIVQHDIIIFSKVDVWQWWMHFQLG